MEEHAELHIVMLPWLALGHLLPFLELSKRIARHGHRVSFLSTPRNLQRLPTVPPELSPLIDLVELRLPSVENLPENAEATIDLPSDELRPYLRKAFDALDRHLLTFLQNENPDWILLDYAAYWGPQVATESGVPCAYLSLFNAAVLAFHGPPSALMGGEGAWSTAEQFTKPPPWIPFPSTIAYNPHEARELFKPGVLPDASGVSEGYRFGKTLEGCQLVAVRSCREFEAEWFQLLEKLYCKPVIPVGFFAPLPPQLASHDEQSYGRWGSTFQWLDKQKTRSVVYVAFGSEVKLTSSQVSQIAQGLNLSQLLFLWALRAPEGSPEGSNALPEGFETETEGRGVVCMDWVPQVQFLAHPSIGGFLTHGGWNSIVEGLALGLPIILLPMIFDQGLNARNLVARRISVEVPRNDEDGSFTGEEIAKTLRLVMVEDEGKQYRVNANKSRELFGDHEMHDKLVKEFLKYLLDHRRPQAQLI